MQTLSTQEIMSLMESARFDPANQLRNVIRRTNEILDERYQLVDPTTPLMLLMEMACAGAANTAIHHEAEMRRRMPMLAQTKEDLYFHMTDRQYLGAFAVPPVTTVGMVIPKQNIQENAKDFGTAGVKLLTMPKNSMWQVGNYEFTLEYPIEFKIMPDGGMTIGFGSPSIDPLHRIESNLINWDIVNYENYECVRMYIPVRQMSISTQIFRLNRSSTSVGKLTYTDKFHYLRAFIRKTVNGKRVWHEIRTTHNEHVFDPYHPTLLVRDLDMEATLTLPAVYHSLNMVGDEIRVDLYTTKAQNDVVLSEFTDDQWQFEPRDFDNTDNGMYTANFSRLNTLISFSDDFTRSGRDELSFEQLRERIMDVHYGQVLEPITHVNHTLALADKGFSSVKVIDSTTRREFNATRPMPLPLDGYTVTPVSVGIFNTLLRITDLVDVDGVNINGDRATIHPSVLFKYKDGGVSIVDADEKAWLASISGDPLARAVTGAGYLFTPFYNVLDATRDNFEMRAYELDNPSTSARQFIHDNPSLNLDLYTAQSVTVEKTAFGYRMMILTGSGDTYRNLRDDQVGIQLSFTPTGETNPKVILGELVAKDSGNNRIYQFDIRTNYDINSDDELTVLNFISFGDGELPEQMPLSVQMDLCYYVNDYPLTGIQRTSIDDVLNSQILPTGTYGILQERIQVSVGSAIENLWTGARSIVMPEDYEIYDHDMPRLYEKPVYEHDTDGNLVVIETPDGITVNKIHDVGDPVLDPVTGEPLYVYRKGDYVLVGGVPVVRNPRTLTRQLDLVLFDGLYMFANDRSSTEYLAYVKRNIVQWSNEEIAAINKTALDETTVKFKPMSTIGSLKAVVGEGGDIVLEAEQSLSLTIFMTEMGWKNESLKNGLRKLIIQTISEEFAKESISTKNIISRLNAKVTSDVLGIELMGLGGEDYNYPLITLKDGSGRPSIRKKLTPLPNRQYTVEEDINISFVPHLPARSDR